MNILKINLNLLKVFIVLMRDQHVSAAAKNLNLTQSAISNSLQQLCEIFHDELLICGTKKMIPTKKALLLVPKIEAAIYQLEESVFKESELNLGIGLEESFPKTLKSERLYSDHAVCVARAHHPIFKKKLTQESYFAAEHLGTCIYSETLKISVMIILNDSHYLKS